MIHVYCLPLSAEAFYLSEKIEPTFGIEHLFSIPASWEPYFRTQDQFAMACDHFNLSKYRNLTFAGYIPF